jgi:hypothetical protein
MADRQLGMFTFNANFEVGFLGPLDARITTPEYSQLTDGSIPFPYPGMLVAVTSDTDTSKNGVWLLTDTSASAGSQTSHWSLVGGGGGNPVTDVSFDAATGELKVTLTHDGNGDTNTPIVLTTTVQTGNLFEFSAPGNDFYTLGLPSEYESGSNENPTIYVVRGATYTFKRVEAGHPLKIYDANNTNISTGILMELEQH